MNAKPAALGFGLVQPVLYICADFGYADYYFFGHFHLEGFEFLGRDSAS